MARFSVLSHETKALFWRAPGRAQNLVDSHCCHNRREGREARGICEVQAGSPRVRGSQVGGVPAWVAVARNRTTHEGACAVQILSRFAAAALNQTSGAFVVGLAAIAEAPASHARQAAQVKVSRLWDADRQSPEVLAWIMEQGTLMREPEC